ncbi:MAG TPA: ATP-binding protein [Longimicrobiales bacterium]|nr:ATP-binding protein [Longimicrobiales bacterium]
MPRRLSARTVITISTLALTVLIIVLITAVIRESLADSYPAAIPIAIRSVWRVGIIMVLVTALAAWTLSSVIVTPMSDIRRKLSLSARSRALADPEAGEMEEVADLRNAVRAIVDELEQAAKHAERGERRVLSLFERINEGVAHINANARFVHANGAARKFLGLPSQPEGHPVATLVRNAELRNVLESASRGQQTDAAELVVDGRQLLITSGALTTPGGENDGTIVTIVDLTELRRLESVRRDFVANVSHELKTPLTSIRGYTETLLSDELAPDARRQFLDVILSNTTRIQRIVEELLDLSRLQSGGWQPKLQPVDAAGLARDVWKSSVPASEPKSIAFDIAGSGDVVADPDALRQVLSNLFENAIRYTPANGRVDVVITRVFPASKTGAFINIEVRDTGSGIPTESIPRIFERFYRVDPARSREEGGTGLGLSIVKHFVDRMGGDVFARSQLGSGTSVHVRLPEQRV